MTKKKEEFASLVQSLVLMRNLHYDILADLESLALHIIDKEDSINPRYVSHQILLLVTAAKKIIKHGGYP